MGFKSERDRERFNRDNERMMKREERLRKIEDRMISRANQEGANRIGRRQERRLDRDINRLEKKYPRGEH